MLFVIGYTLEASFSKTIFMGLGITLCHVEVFWLSQLGFGKFNS
jgi:hypothetical protein